MKRILCVALVLLGCACSRRSLQVIEHVATADASPPVDTSPPDTRPADTSLPDTRPADSTPPDTRPADTRPADTSPPDTRPADTSLPDAARPVTCPSPVVQPWDGERTIKVGSDDRSYYLHIPTTYDGTQPVPLIFDFHALFGSGQSQSKSSSYPKETDSDGAVMVFPTGKNTAWNLGPCCVADVDDVAFTKAIIEQVKKTLCIDTKRIYAVGHITGGGMAYTLACRAADTFAAVAASAWDLLDKVECNPSRPITVVSFRNAGDTLIPYGGGDSDFLKTMPVTFLGAIPTFKKWAALDKCTGEPSKEDSNDCSRYSNCGGGVEVWLCTKPGSQSDPSDPSIAWPVLKKYSLPQL